MNGGAYVGVFVIGLAVLLTWAIVEIVKNEKDSDGDSRPIPEGDSDLQVALNAATPGSIINIDEGEYYVSLTTAVDGTADEPITLRGRPGTDPERVILKGADDKSRVLEILHSYYVIEDFTIDTEIEEGEEYREHPIFVEGSIEPTEVDGVLSSLDGTVIRRMIIRNAGQECIRLKYFVTNSVITENYIENCGIHDFVFGDSGENGEGVYIGTSTDQWDEKFGDDRVDVCQGNVVYANYIDTQGSEGVEVKEGSVGNLIQENEILGQLAENSGGIGVRGSSNIVRYNTIVEAVGACIRIGGSEVDDVQYGIDNEVYENELIRCENSAIKVVVDPQIICDNDWEDADDEDYIVVRGDAASSFEDIGESCPLQLTSASIPPTPTPPTTTTTMTTLMDDDDSVDTERDVEQDENAETDGYEFLGCFADSESNRVLELDYTDEDDMTVESCVNACLRADADYAGLQNGSECWCGSPDEYDVYGTGSCNYDCPGDSSTLCGGSESFSLFAIYGEPTDDGSNDDGDSSNDNLESSVETTDSSQSTDGVVAGTDDTTDTGVDDIKTYDAKLVGCFLDSASNPVLNSGFQSVNMTQQACFSFCDEEDEEFAGLEDGNECWCGSDDDYDQFGTSTCTMPCAGESSTVCGGDSSIAIWRID